MPLDGKHILLGITGGIAAYKTPALVRQLTSQGADVQVVMTQGAAQFVTATTLQAVSGKPVRRRSVGSPLPRPRWGTSNSLVGPIAS